jgi:hypothetical protein
LVGAEAFAAFAAADLVEAALEVVTLVTVLFTVAGLLDAVVEA